VRFVVVAVVEFCFVLDYFSILMLHKSKRNFKLKKNQHDLIMFLHRALVSVLIDGDGEFGDGSRPGFAY